MKFTIYNPATGNVIRVGSCPEEFVHLQVADGEALHRGEAALEDRVVEGAVHIGANPPPAPQPPDYATRRRLAYPPIAEQLDALWKWMADPKAPEVPDMVKRIQAVKAAHPKA